MSGENDMLAANTSASPVASPTSLNELFHRLNNQLGIVLANAELVEARARDEATRARAAQVIDSALQALETVRTLRREVEREPHDS
jgi:hypothetical protein